MQTEIKKAYEFDFVHDSQQAFRQILKALSNPGKVCHMEEQAEKFPEYFASLCAAGCVFLDNEVTMYVEKNPKLQDILGDLTLSRPAAYQEADFIFLSSEMNYGSVKEMFLNCRRGTYADPQASAVFLILCEDFAEESGMKLTGPGVKGELILRTRKYIRQLLKLRQDLNMEYPLGIDLLFFSRRGEILGFPRLIKMTEIQEG